MLAFLCPQDRFSLFGPPGPVSVRYWILARFPVQIRQRAAFCLVLGVLLWVFALGFRDHGEFLEPLAYAFEELIAA